VQDDFIAWDTAVFMKGLRNWMLHRGLVPVRMQARLNGGGESFTYFILLGLEQLKSWGGWEPQAKEYLSGASSDLRLRDVIESYYISSRVVLSVAREEYVTVRAFNSKNSKPRNVPVSERVVAMLRTQKPRKHGLVFSRVNGDELTASELDQHHDRVRTLLKLSAEFVLHSLRHTFGTRLGESGADAFTIMKLMGHSSVTVSQRYVHPSPESVERAFERMQNLNRSEAERKRGVPTILPTVGNDKDEKLQ
jgi:integrase